MPACRPDRAALVRVAVAGMLTLGMAAIARAQTALPPITVNPGLLSLPKRLQLEIFVNGQPVGFIEEFFQRSAETAFFAKRADLEEAGIKTPPGPQEDSVSLASLGAEFRYDDARQRMDFILRDDQRLPRVYNARGSANQVTAQVDPGFLLNYSLFGGTLSADSHAKLAFSGGNALLDARAFSKFGVLYQSGIVGSTLYRSHAAFLRLDTTFAYTHPATTTTYRAGDIISNGLAWTRPIRLGGLQVQRDFALRPDLITRPLPSLSGSAAVPSSVDVFVNGVKAFSQEVGIGPYRIADIPGAGANGEARAIIRDATGRQTETSISFQSAAQLLRPGLTDFSVEAGLARLNYGFKSQDYDRHPVGSATLRRGMTEWATLEAHAEGGAGLINGGLGAVIGAGRFGAFSGAGALSSVNGSTGWMAYLGWDAQFKWLSVSASSLRASRAYEDIASVTAPAVTAQPQPGLSLGGISLPFAPAAGAHPLLSLDRVSVGGPLPFDTDTSANLSLVQLRQREGKAQRLVTASLTRSLPKFASLGRGSVFISGFADMSSRRNRGIYAGLSMPFGLDSQVSAGVAWTPGSGTLATVDALKPQPLEDNTYGWRLRDQEGKAAYRSAGASYRSPYGQIGGQVDNYRGSTTGTAQFDGSLALMGGGFFIGNKVESSFAVVNAGRAGVPVLQDNRIVGRTNASGKLLVANLRPYEGNRIGIDTTNLPPDEDIASTSRMVAPMLKSGLVLDFGSDRQRSNAIVILSGPDGKLIEPGHKARLGGAPETFIVGYDGRTYLTGLGPANRVSVDLGSRDCVAEFAFRTQPGAQSVIRDVVCR